MWEWDGISSIIFKSWFIRLVCKNYVCPLMEMLYLIYAGCRLQFYCSGNWGVPAIWILRDVVRGSNLLLCICGLWRHSNLWYVLSFVLIFDKVYNNFFKCQLTGNMVKIISSNEIRWLFLINWSFTLSWTLSLWFLQVQVLHDNVGAFLHQNVVFFWYVRPYMQ